MRKAINVLCMVNRWWWCQRRDLVMVVVTSNGLRNIEEGNDVNHGWRFFDFTPFSYCIRVILIFSSPSPIYFILSIYDLLGFQYQGLGLKLLSLFMIFLKRIVLLFWSCEACCCWCFGVRSEGSMKVEKLLLLIIFMLDGSGGGWEHSLKNREDSLKTN